MRSDRLMLLAVSVGYLLAFLLQRRMVPLRENLPWLEPAVVMLTFALLQVLMRRRFSGRLGSPISYTDILTGAAWIIITATFTFNVLVIDRWVGPLLWLTYYLYGAMVIFYYLLPSIRISSASLLHRRERRQPAQYRRIMAARARRAESGRERTGAGGGWGRGGERGGVRRKIRNLRKFVMRWGFGTLTVLACILLPILGLNRSADGPVVPPEFLDGDSIRLGENILDLFHSRNLRVLEYGPGVAEDFQGRYFQWIDYGTRFENETFMAGPLTSLYISMGNSGLVRRDVDSSAGKVLEICRRHYGREDRTRIIHYLRRGTIDVTMTSTSKEWKIDDDHWALFDSMIHEDGSISDLSFMICRVERESGTADVPQSDTVEVYIANESPLPPEARTDEEK